MMLKIFSSHVMVVGMVLLGIFYYCGKANFIAAGLGSCAYLIPQLTFLGFMSLFTKRSVYSFVVWFFLGETIKTITAASICVLLVRYLTVSKTFLLTGFIMTIVAVLLVYGFFSYKHYVYCE